MLQLIIIINRKRKSEHILSQPKVRKSLTFAQNEEEYKNDSDNEYESQPIISVKVALENVDNLMRFVNDPPSGLAFDRKAFVCWNLTFYAIKRTD